MAEMSGSSVRKYNMILNILNMDNKVLHSSPSFCENVYNWFFQLARILSSRIIHDKLNTAFGVAINSKF